MFNDNIELISTEENGYDTDNEEESTVTECTARK